MGEQGKDVMAALVHCWHEGVALERIAAEGEGGLVKSLDLPPLARGANALGFC
jgi:hypothetical protein